MNDHDLLIRIDEQIKTFIKQMTDMHVLLGTKVDRTEVKSFFNESDKVHDDHEKRIRDLNDSEASIMTKISEIKTQMKTWGAVAFFGVTVLEIFIKAVSK